MSAKQSPSPSLPLRLLSAIRARPRAMASFAITLGLGIAVLSEALTHQIGRINRMGPGYFPTILGVALILLSFTHLFERDSEGGERFPTRWLPVLVVPLAMALFAFLIEPYGLFPATMALVLVAGLADQTIRPALLLVMAALVPVAVTIIFVWLLGLPIQPFRW